jgi:DNA-binding MarR family transcriptional regulator
MMAGIEENLEFLLARVGRAHRHLLGQSLDKVGLYRGQPPLLMALHEADGVAQSELAARMEVTPATITNAVKRMEKAGLVVRRRDSEDERVSRVYLTDAGRGIFADLEAIAKQVDETTFAGFTDEERLVMRGFLNRVHDNLRRALAERELAC